MTEDIPIRDRPLLFRHFAGDDTLRRLDLFTGNSQQDCATAAIVGQLADHALRQDQSWISYSRSFNWYAGETARHLKHTPLTYRRVIRALDMLDRAGLIEHVRARPSRPNGSSERRQSTFRPRPGAFASAREAIAIDMIGPSLILRDADGFPLPFPETARAERARKQLEHINDMLTGVDLGGPDLAPGGYMNTGRGVLVPVRRLHLRRIFNLDLKHGGRAYAPFQNLPREVRERCTLNGKPVVRVDHPCLHPQLLYAQHGVDFDPDTNDAYDVPGWPRKLVKKVFNVLVNGATPTAARSRTCFELGLLRDDPHCAAAMSADRSKSGWAWHRLREAHGREADLLIEAIHLRHEGIASSFGSGAGLRLQNIDAGMTLSVTSKLLARGIPSPPIHDENIAPKNYEGQVREVMTDALAKIKNDLISKAGLCTPKTAVSCADMGGVLRHYGPAASSALVADPVPASQHGSAASAASPPSSDCHVTENGSGEQIGEFYKMDASNLFPVEGADAALRDFQGGVLSFPARAALRHEIRARGMTQARLAARVGVSRPQMVNVLCGRFGLGEAAATRLKDFLAA
jgi:hypothetical protein